MENMTTDHRINDYIRRGIIIAESKTESSFSVCLLEFPQQLKNELIGEGRRVDMVGPNRYEVSWAS